MTTQQPEQIGPLSYHPFDDDVAVSGPNAPQAEQIDDLIRLLVTIRHRCGNTAIQYRIFWGGSAFWAAGALRNVILECESRIGGIDNGKCAVCKTGFRAWKPDGKPGPCENKDCLSHRIDDALGR